MQGLNQTKFRRLFIEMRRRSRRERDAEGVEWVQNRESQLY